MLVLSFIMKCMKIESPAFASNTIIPEKYTCEGEDNNPPLTITDVPGDAKSLALIMHDPDSPTGDWVHWTIWNLDPKTTSIPESLLPPEASQGVTSFKSIGYGGACPHDGTHRYVFDLYALDKQLDLGAGATREQLLQVIDGHVIETAQLVGIFSAE